MIEERESSLVNGNLLYWMFVWTCYIIYIYIYRQYDINDIHWYLVHGTLK